MERHTWTGEGACTTLNGSPFAVALIIGMTCAATLSAAGGGATPPPGSAAVTAPSPIGLRVMVQGWNPQSPDQANVTMLVNHPSMVSDSLGDAWSRLRIQLCDQLRNRMGLGGGRADRQRA